jgi:hypothetical protein
MSITINDEFVQPFTYAGMSEDDQLQVRLAVASVIEQMAAAHASGKLMHGTSERFTIAGHQVRVDGNALGIRLDVTDVAESPSGQLHIPLLDGVDLTRDNAGAASRAAEREDWLDSAYQHGRLGIFAS